MKNSWTHYLSLIRLAPANLDGSDYKSKVLSSSPTVGTIFHFVFFGFPRASCRSNALIQMKSSMTFIRGSRCIERIWSFVRKMGAVLVPSSRSLN